MNGSQRIMAPDVTMSSSRHDSSRRASLLARARNSPVAAFTMATALSQIFPLMSAPILTRLYTPAAFGGYAIYVALTTILGTLAILSMQHAVLLEQTAEDAVTAMVATMVPPVIFTTLLLAVLTATLFIFDVELHANLGRLLIFMPATVLLSSLYTAGYTWLLRVGRYRALALNKLVLAASTMVFQIGVGLLRLETLGFILANLLGYVLATVLVFSTISSNRRGKFRMPASGALWAAYRKHRGLAFYTTPSTLLNTVCSSVPELLLARLFGPTVLGHYSLGVRCVSAPMTFVSSAVSDVFRRDAALQQNSTGQCRTSFKTYFYLMSGFALAVLVPLIVLLPSFFRYVFGPDWTPSGTYVQCLTLLLVIRFVSSPLSYVWIVAGKQHYDMAWQLGLLILSVAAFLIPELVVRDLTPQLQFIIYSTVVGAWYALALFLSYYWSAPHGKPAK